MFSKRALLPAKKSHFITVSAASQKRENGAPRAPVITETASTLAVSVITETASTLAVSVITQTASTLAVSDHRDSKHACCLCDHRDSKRARQD